MNESALWTDADRLAMLEGFGAGHVTIGQAPPITALFRSQPLEMGFDSARISGTRPTLRALMSDVRRHGIKAGDAVSVPLRGEYYIADIQDENGMALIELRQE